MLDTYYLEIRNIYDRAKGKPAIIIPCDDVEDLYHKLSMYVSPVPPLKVVERWVENKKNVSIIEEDGRYRV